jgi:hypothetical protein
MRIILTLIVHALDATDAYVARYDYQPTHLRE